MNEKVFKDEELSRFYVFSNKKLPTVNDCLLYVLSRTTKEAKREKTRAEAIWDLAKIVQDVWDAADCCPYTRKHIVTLFEKNIWNKYTYLLREKHLPGDENTTKRSHKKDPTKHKDKGEPTRKSRRIQTSETFETPSNEELSTDDITSVVCNKSTTTRSKVSTSLRESWDRFGKMLFDVKSPARVLDCSKKGLCFDESFYNDQQSERKMEMYLSKVTKEYAEQEQERMKREARQQSRLRSAFNNATGTINSDVDIIDEPTDELTDVQIDSEDECEESLLKSPEPSSVKSTITRKIQKFRSKSEQAIMIHTACQTNPIDLINFPLRVESSPGSGVFSKIKPDYLEAMALMMSENFSATEALKAVYITDTVIWKQTRHLALRLDKHYVNSIQLLKKLDKDFTSRNKNDNITNEILDSAYDVAETDSVSVNEFSTATAEKIKQLRETVSECKSKRRNDKGNTLPDVTCVRSNHNLISVYCEGKIADEVLENQAFIIPDGTSRQGVGDIAGAVVKVSSHIRALKGLQIGKGDRENWAKAIYHMLDRLATASNKDVSNIWLNIVAMISDLCKVNLNLANEVKKLVGVEWIPGQAFCNLHYTLAIPEGIKNVLSMYQCSIGADKLFPKNVSFEMNIEDKILVVQILDCWLRLTSVRWQSKPWNRYSVFTEYAERQGIRNVGHMLHANRFGEFEERCAGGLYLADCWMTWLRTYAGVRNQLACFLRSISGLIDMCKFLWAGAALVGIHVTSPFMSMLLEHKVTPRKLLDVLPQMYKDLNTYPKSFINLDRCGLPALEEFFSDPLKKETSCYGVEVCKHLSEYLDTCDQAIMDRYLKKICNELAVILKRQRGNQFGFGDDPNSSMDIRKNMTEAMLDDPDATHSKPIENHFGNLDRELKKSGPQGFDKSTSDLVIKYSKDLIDGDHEWCTRANRNAAKQIAVKQKNFDNKQRELIKAGVDDLDASNICSDNKLIKCVAECKKSHNGPLIDVEDLEKLERDLDEVALNKALNLEIRFRKLSLTDVKDSCSLFRQRGLTIAEKKRNLSTLITSQLDFCALASMEDLEEAINVYDVAEVTEKNEQVVQPQPLETDKVASQLIESENEFKVDEFIIVLFEDGAYPGQVIEMNGENIETNFMVPLIIKGETRFDLWKWPSTNDKHMISKESILPIRPCLDISLRYSSKRSVVFELLNSNFVQKFI